MPRESNYLSDGGDAVDVATRVMSAVDVAAVIVFVAVCFHVRLSTSRMPASPVRQSITSWTSKKTYPGCTDRLGGEPYYPILILYFEVLIFTKYEIGAGCATYDREHSSRNFCVCVFVWHAVVAAKHPLLCL